MHPDRHPRQPAVNATWTGLRPSDVVVAVVTAGVALLTMLGSTDASPRDADLLGVAIVLVAATPLLVRRRWPVPVLLTVVAVMVVYFAVGLPGGTELPLAGVALYTAMATGHRAVAIGVATSLLAASVGYRLLVDDDDPLIVAITASLLALVVVLGEAVRARRQLAVEVEERLRVVAADKELEARAERTEERLRLARELHDVLAHTITTITVQAGAAADGVSPDSEAYQALRAMRGTALDATRQLRTTIGLLRTGPDPTRDGPGTSASETAAIPGVGDLPALVDRVAAAGLTVGLETRGAPVRPLPSEVGLAVHRIVQEALTNVIRHADTDRADVVVNHLDDRVEVTITDGGRGGGPEGSPGFGIVGMRERARALGGQLSAGGAPGGGFVVRAVLPLAGATLDAAAPAVAEDHR